MKVNLLTFLLLDISEEEGENKSRGFVEKVNKLSREKVGGELFNNLEVDHDDAEKNFHLCQLRGWLLAGVCTALES